ncbi:Hypothetical protein AA314_02478 [Archangium gephyra]|uniref:Uncharacterized protein n=1 Tax=Archangium gephyra TaxID=48 RepID=A0AAC8TCK3_9BACT|nr:Hypothetical protein AA314_02478 [Archangium gephyra]
MARARHPPGQQRRRTSRRAMDRAVRSPEGRGPLKHSVLEHVQVTPVPQLRQRHPAEAAVHLLPSGARGQLAAHPPEQLAPRVQKGQEETRPPRTGSRHGWHLELQHVFHLPRDGPVGALAGREAPRLPA